MIYDHFAMECIWDHLIGNELKVNPTEYPVLATYAPQDYFGALRCRMCEVFFERLSVPSLNLGLNAALSLHASGRATGTVIDSGAENTYIVTIYEGVANMDALCKTSIGNSHVTEALWSSLLKRGFIFLPSEHQKQFVDDTKKASAFICHSDEVVYRRQVGKSTDQALKLPNGQDMQCGTAASQSAEGLFFPSIYGFTDAPINVKLYTTLLDSRYNQRTELSENVVLVCQSPESNRYTF